MLVPIQKFEVVQQIFKFNTNCHDYQLASNALHKDVSTKCPSILLAPFTVFYDHENSKNFRPFPIHFPFAVPVHGIFSSNGIFIWWPKVEHINVTAYLIQFKGDETTTFSDHVVGTIRNIDEFETWNEVSNDLTHIPATTNIYPNDVKDEAMRAPPTENDKKTSSIVELRVNGNVSGILIPNTHEIVVRVLVPVVDEDGELDQDMRYIEWKKVCVGKTFCHNNFA